MLSLSAVPADTLQTIKWCFLDETEHLAVESFGLVQGAQVQIIASHRGGVVISVGNVRLALGREVADRIKV